MMWGFDQPIPDRKLKDVFPLKIDRIPHGYQCMYELKYITCGPSNVIV